MYQVTTSSEACRKGQRAYILVYRKDPRGAVQPYIDSEQNDFPVSDASALREGMNNNMKSPSQFILGKRARRNALKLMYLNKQAPVLTSVKCTMTSNDS